MLLVVAQFVNNFIGLLWSVKFHCCLQNISSLHKQLRQKPTRRIYSWHTGRNIRPVSALHTFCAVWLIAQPLLDTTVSGSVSLLAPDAAINMDPDPPHTRILHSMAPHKPTALFNRDFPQAHTETIHTPKHVNRVTEQSDNVATIFSWFLFLSLCIWLYVLYAFV
jgi:hypothetical protein